MDTFNWQPVPTRQKTVDLDLELKDYKANSRFGYCCWQGPWVNKATEDKHIDKNKTLNFEDDALVPLSLKQDDARYAPSIKFPNNADAWNAQNPK